MRRKEGDKATGILNAAIAVFARDGFDKAQVSVIANEAGVGTGSIYLYFSGKDAILHCLFARFWENLASQMNSLPQNDPLFRMNDQLGLFFDRLVENKDLAKVYLRDHHRFLEAPAAAGISSYRTCLELGRKAFVEVAKSSGKKIPSAKSLDLAQAFLFGGVRAALEFGLERTMPPAKVKRHMQTMAMASLLAAIEGVEP
jgi:TetR/AcrR family fatty acid metabolism transcriptional regulator